MAMTKKERAEFDAAIERAETLAALRWTTPVARDVMPPKSGFEYSEGWNFNTHTARVWQAWSDFTSHGDGPAPQNAKGYVPAAQGARRLYSTKALALAALRHELEMEAAKRLRAVDRQIAEALAALEEA